VNPIIARVDTGKEQICETTMQEPKKEQALKAVKRSRIRMMLSTAVIYLAFRLVFAWVLGLGNANVSLHVVRLLVEALSFGVSVGLLRWFIDSRPS
jgi:hypothetical protein